MKKTILSIFASLIMLASFAQNGGQNNENNSTRIEFVAFSQTGQVIVKVTNKQSCTADMRVTSGNTSQVKSVPATQFDTFHVNNPANGKIRAKTETNCGNADFGQVEITVPVALPIHFEYIKTTKLDGRTIMVEFKALETDGEDRFNIQLSTDGKTFRTVAIVFPDPIEVNKIYNVKISL